MNDSNDAPRADDVDGTTVMVTFVNLDEIRPSPVVLTFTYDVSGNGVSHPGLVEFYTPEPTASALALAALCLAIRRRRIAAR